MATAKIMVSLFLQLMKATVLAESSWSLGFYANLSKVGNVYRHESGRCHTLLPFLTYFLSFHLSRFSFYVNTVRIKVSLFLQLMKATVLAESASFCLFFLDFLCSAAVCSQSFLPFLTNFLSYISRVI